MNVRSTGASRPRPRANVITVDVEEWFHICGFGPLSQERWDSLPSRVVLTTRALLEELDRAGARATFSFLAGSLAPSGLIGTFARPAMTSVARAPAHARVRARRGDVRRGFETERRGAARRGCRAHRWIPGARVVVNDRSLWRSSASSAKASRSDAKHGLSHRGSVNYPRGPHVRHTSAGPIFEVSPWSRSSRAAMPTRMGLGLAHGRRPRMLARSSRSTPRPAGRLTVHPWEIDPEPPRISLPPRFDLRNTFVWAASVSALAALLSAGDFGALSDVPALQSITMSSVSFSVRLRTVFAPAVLPRA